MGELVAGFDSKRRGSFRSWLMTCLRNLTIKDHHARRTLKRGGGWKFESLDSEAVEREMLAIQAAHLEHGPACDLILARCIWRSVARRMEEGRSAERVRLIRDLLPLVLFEKWPPPPFPTQQEMADKHDMTVVNLRGYFHHTLKGRVRKLFAEEILGPPDEADYLWHMLCRYGDAA